MQETILYIEDNPLNMRLVRKILRAAGYEIIEAMDGLTGVETAMRERPDLILMDINLPDIDGMDATRRLKESADTAHIPVIAVTANSMPGDRERYVDSGCDAYVAKPITRNELLNTIAHFISDGVQDAAQSNRPAYI